MNQPQIQDYPDWAKNYISLVEGDIVEILTQQATDFPNFINNLVEKADYAYAPGKWTIKEMIGHIIDTERILTYRLLCIARGEKALLPGFEEADYVANANFKSRSLFSFSEEFALMRKSHIYLIQSLNDEELNRMGNANNREMSARELVFLLAGHVMHHVNIVKERYL